MFIYISPESTISFVFISTHGIHRRNVKSFSMIDFRSLKPSVNVFFMFLRVTCCCLQVIRTTDTLNIFCWNASNGLLLDEWVTWLTQISYDVVILQETGWRFSNQGGFLVTGTCCIPMAIEPQFSAWSADDCCDQINLLGVNCAQAGSSIFDYISPESTISFVFISTHGVRRRNVKSFSRIWIRIFEMHWMLAKVMGRYFKLFFLMM